MILKEIWLIVFRIIIGIFNMKFLLLFFKLYVSKKKWIIMLTNSFFCLDPTEVGQKRNACYIQLDASFLLFFPNSSNLKNFKRDFDYIVNFK